MLHIQTPLINSNALSRHLGQPVYLKMEALQPSGSFKLRGIGHACEFHYQMGIRHFLSSSGGNAGIAVAVAGRYLGVPVTVVVPESTTRRAHEVLRLEGAQVKVYGASWKEAHEMAQSLKRDDSVLLHPFDDPLLCRNGPVEIGAPGRIRTADHCVRSAVLYPAELRAQPRRSLPGPLRRCTRGRIAFGKGAPVRHCLESTFFIQ